MKHPYKGHVYGLNTKRGIAILQLAEEPDTPNSLQLTRICDGFLNKSYNDDDVYRIVSNEELFFMDMPLRNIKPRSQLYKQFFVFDKPFALPDEMRLPQEQRGFVALNDGTVKLV